MPPFLCVYNVRLLFLAVTSLVKNCRQCLKPKFLVGPKQGRSRTSFILLRWLHRAPAECDADGAPLALSYSTCPNCGSAKQSHYGNPWSYLNAGQLLVGPFAFMAHPDKFLGGLT